jgi:hypothetical protein
MNQAFTRQQAKFIIYHCVLSSLLIAEKWHAIGMLAKQLAC